MFSRIVVVLNELPESRRALRTAIDLASSLKASLATLSILGDLPAYASFASIVNPTAPIEFKEEHRKLQALVHQEAVALAQEKGITASSHILDGREVKAVLEFLKEEKADLLVVGLHQHDFYIARLWSSVYELAQGAPCSVLGVH